MTTGRPPHSEGLQLTDIRTTYSTYSRSWRKRPNFRVASFKFPIRPLPIRVPHEPAPCRRSRQLTSSEVLAAESPAKVVGHGRSDSVSGS